MVPGRACRPGTSIWSVSPAHRILRLVVPAVAIGVVVAIQRVYFNRGLIPGDSYTYLAAGERLNAGHLLYALSPGDRPVGFEPPFFTVPLLSPPPIAVLFRPLAAIPNELGVYIWWIATIVILAAVIVSMLRRRPILVGLAVLVLSLPIVYQIGVGNLNGLIVAGTVVAWYLLRRGRDVAAGAVFALMTAFKITPGVFMWWLITQRRWDAFKAFVVAGLAILAISVLGAGLAAHFEYLGIIGQTATAGTTYLSLAGAARYIGVPAELANVLPTVAIVVGAAAIWLLRSRPGAAYAAAVITMIAGSPVVQITWFTILLAALAPIVWPMPARAHATTDDASESATDRAAGLPAAG
jgi:Glycosyltransferase family 87